MTQHQPRRFRQVGQLSLIFIFLLMICGSGKATSQIVPDRTLPTNSNVNIGCTVCTITGGTPQGRILFHSFDKFSIPTNGEVRFNNNPLTRSIVTRVTGSQLSEIDGLITANGSANLFLINPNGITFGPNAQLQLGGSFIASTANSFLFPGSVRFSATNPTAPPILDVQVEAPIGLQFEGQTNAIQVQGSRLEIKPSETLALIGGNIKTDNASLKAPDGQIEIGALSGTGEIKFVTDSLKNIINLSTSSNAERANVSLTNTQVDVSRSGSGIINIIAHDIYSEASQLSSGIQKSQVASRERAGNITLDATTIINLDKKSLITTNVESDGRGNAGNIDIKSDVVSLLDNSEFTSRSYGRGNGGNVTITANEVKLQQHSAIATALEPGGEGKAGDIKIYTGSFTLANLSNLVSSTAGMGDSGRILIQASGIASFESGSTVFNNVEPDGYGQSQGIEINAGSLQVLGGSELQTVLRGIGKGGDININVKDNVIIKHSNSPTNTFTAIITEANPNTVGDAGSLNIKARNVYLLDGGRLFSRAQGFGNAGSVTLTADEIDIKNQSFIISNVESNGEGNAGNIDIKANIVSLTDNSELTSRSYGKGNGGDVTITANEVKLQQHSAIATALEPGGEGNAGNIKIRTGSFTLANRSNLVSSTASSGNSGNLSIQADGVVSFESGSTVFNNVEPGGRGQSGGVDIKAGSLAISDGAELQTILREPSGNASGGVGRGGDVNIDVKDSFTISHSINTTNTFTAIYTEANPGTIGNAGDINIKARSISLLDGGGLFSRTGGIGNAGNVSISANEVNIKNQSFITNKVGIEDKLGIIRGEGNAGNIRIDADSFSLTDNSRMENSTAASGKAGNVSIQAHNSAVFQASSILTNVESTGQDRGGDITIGTKKLSVVDGSQLVADTSGRKQAGNIYVNASSIQVSGTNAVNGESSGLFTDTNSPGKGGTIIVDAENFSVSDRAVLSTRTRNTGEGGQITVNATNFEAKSGGQLITTTSGSKPAGSIAVNVTQSLNLNGNAASLISNQDNVQMDSDQVVRSGLFANTDKGSTGSGGNVTINSQQQPVNRLTVQDGARVSVDSQGQGQGGDINIFANRVDLNNGKITASTTLNNGGNINLRIRNLLLMQKSSQISTNAGTAGDSSARGDGGNIRINRNPQVSIEKDVKQGFIVALPSENSDITANSFSNQGGKVEISVQRVFGLVSRSREELVQRWSALHGGEKPKPEDLDSVELFLSNDITAISQGNPLLNGVVSLSTNFDPSQGLNQVPQEPGTTEVADSCQISTDGKEVVRFYDIGRGGLPIRPEDPLSIDLLEWSSLDSTVKNRSPLKTISQTPQYSSKQWSTTSAESSKLFTTNVLRLVMPCQSR